MAIARDDSVVVTSNMIPYDRRDSVESSVGSPPGRTPPPNASTLLIIGRTMGALLGSSLGVVGSLDVVGCAVVGLAVGRLVRRVGFIVGCGVALAIFSAQPVYPKHLSPSGQSAGAVDGQATAQRASAAIQFLPQ